MKEQIQSILDNLKKDLGSAKEAKALQDIRVKYLGKKGEITALMKCIGQVAPENKAAVGQMVNDARKAAECAIEGAAEEINRIEKQSRLEKERIDVTLPGKASEIGGVHPLTKTYLEIRNIFTDMGYSIEEGPEVEFDKFNFEMLNIPKNHPARDEQDTFYVSDDVVLRTHTSPAQVRTMLKRTPPIKMICPGRVYRCDDVDATHSPVFNQIEGLVIDKGITFADLKGTVNTFLKKLYGEQTKTKFRPGYFPFTEPSAEVDATCTICGGKGCPACKGAGMIEVLGCGMVNPKVLEFCGIDPDEYSGFAFGLGLDRLCNIKYGVTDIRLLYENDVRFLRQFR